MLNDSDLDPCRGDRFDAIALRSHARRPAVADCFVANAGIGSPVLLARHGGGECVVEHDDRWQAAHRAGWSVHRPVSSQRAGAGLATWHDIDLAIAECGVHIARIGLIAAIASYSLGGSVALRLLADHAHRAGLSGRAVAASRRGRASARPYRRGAADDRDRCRRPTPRRHRRGGRSALRRWRLTSFLETEGRHPGGPTVP